MTASTQDSPPPDSSDGPPAFAIMHPDGTLEWKPLAAEDDVRNAIGGKHGASSVAGSIWIGPAGETSPDASVRILASDIASVLPEDYALNIHAQRVLVELSEEKVTQAWRGVVVLSEYDKDPGTGEVGFPQEMSPDLVRRINAFYEA